MKNDEYNRLFDLAVKIRDEGLLFEDVGNLTESNKKFQEAISIFEKIYSIDVQPDKFNKSLILGGLYKWVGDKEKANQLFITAVSLKPDSEIASLGLYLTYIALERSDLAIDEFERYLNVYPAELYRDTIEELLGDLSDGYATSFKDTIIHLAKKNGFTVNDLGSIKKSP